jgi:hypothetical protein
MKNMFTIIFIAILMSSCATITFTTNDNISYIKKEMFINNRWMHEIRVDKWKLKYVSENDSNGKSNSEDPYTIVKTKKYIFYSGNIEYAEIYKITKWYVIQNNGNSSFEIGENSFSIKYKNGSNLNTEIKHRIGSKYILETNDYKISDYYYVLRNNKLEKFIIPSGYSITKGNEIIGYVSVCENKLMYFNINVNINDDIVMFYMIAYENSIM